VRVWKALGLAGLAGVAATGVVVARNERRRTQMSPDDVRARLHQRYAEVAARQEPIVPDPPPADAPASWWARHRPRRRSRESQVRTRDGGRWDPQL
jgi:hypothetical protein